jgi:predicted nucleotidyltransferase
MNDSTLQYGHSALDALVSGLRKTIGDSLRSVVLYGSAARGDYRKATSDINVLVVVEQLDPTTLEQMSAPIKRWMRRQQPAPRLLSTSIIRESADVFPIEFLELKTSNRILFGEDPFKDFEVVRDHLRIQCERELREKMMRLREAYVEVHNSRRKLTRLLTDSYSTFIALFRGCLHLHGDEVPQRNEDVSLAFCEVAELDLGPFRDVYRLKQGERVDTATHELFGLYYAELTTAVARIDRFVVAAGGAGK